LEGNEINISSESKCKYQNYEIGIFGSGYPGFLRRSFFMT